MKVEQLEINVMDEEGIMLVTDDRFSVWVYDTTFLNEIINAVEKGGVAGGNSTNHLRIQSNDLHGKKVTEVYMYNTKGSTDLICIVFDSSKIGAILQHINNSISDQQ